MTEIKIENKKYVLLPKENYQALQKKAALKSKGEQTFTLAEARSYSKRLILIQLNDSDKEYRGLSTKKLLQHGMKVSLD